MLIEFSSKAYENIVMFERHALKLMHMMGINTKVPGAILSQNVSQALLTLEKALAHESEENKDNLCEGKNTQEDEDDLVSLKQRAYPLIEMLKHAIVKSVDVMWDYY